MQLQHEKQLHQREKETMAVRHDAHQQRISKLRSAAEMHQRHCKKWERKILGHTYHARSQPVFSPLQSSTSKVTLELVAQDLYLSSDEVSDTQTSAIKRLRQAESDFASVVESTRLPANFLGRDVIRYKLTSTLSSSSTSIESTQVASSQPHSEDDPEIISD